MPGEAQHERRDSCDAWREKPERFGFFLCVGLSADGGRLPRARTSVTASDHFGVCLYVARSKFGGRFARSGRQGDEAHRFGKFRYDRSE